MKFTALKVAMLASTTVALPTMEALGALARLNAREVDQSAPQGKGALPSTPPAFDAVAQRVDVSGEHRVGM